eukprot:gene3290-3608_t
MDYTDKIILLKSRIASKVTPDDELIKQLDIGLGIIKNTDSDALLTEQDKEFLESVIQKTEKIVGRGPIELLNDIVTVGQVPRDLYDETLPGGTVFDRVSQVPAFQVRGKRYLSDGKKISSSPPLFFLRGMQVVRLNQFKYHVAMEDWCGYPKCSHDNEWLILNYMIPGSTCVQVVALYTATPEVMEVIRAFTSGSESDMEAHRQPWSRLLQQFWTADDRFCNNRFKLIPYIAEGSWAIKMAVGQKPALTGKKVSQHYYRGPGYFEIDVDLSSSAIATGILAMVRGVSKSMVVDLGVSIQGENEDELPEAVLCQTRFSRVDLEAAVSV